MSMAAPGPALAQPGLTYILYREPHPDATKPYRVRVRNSENFWRGAVKGQHVYFVPDPTDPELNNATVKIVIELLPGADPATHGPFGSLMTLETPGPYQIVNDTWAFTAWCYLKIGNDEIGYDSTKPGYDETKDGGRPCYNCP